MSMNLELSGFCLASINRVSQSFMLRVHSHLTFWSSIGDSVWIRYCKRQVLKPCPEPLAPGALWDMAVSINYRDGMGWDQSNVTSQCSAAPS